MKKTHLRPLSAILTILIFLLTVSCYLLSPPREALKFSPEVLPNAHMGIPYDATATISKNVTPAGQFSISEGTLPPGLALAKVLNRDAVRIFGTPDKAGTYSFTIFFWCYGTNVSGQTGEMKYTIAVQ